MTRFFARAWWIAAVLAVATTSWSQPTLIHAPDPSDPMAVHVYRLKNGLTVYLSENDQKPRFYAEIVVRAEQQARPGGIDGDRPLPRTHAVQGDHPGSALSTTRPRGFISTAS